MEDLEKFVGKEVSIELVNDCSGKKEVVVGKMVSVSDRYYLLHNSKSWIDITRQQECCGYKYRFLVKGDCIYYTPGTIKLVNEYPKMMMVWDNHPQISTLRNVIGFLADQYIIQSSTGNIAGYKNAEDIKPEPKYWTKEQYYAWVCSGDALGWQVAEIEEGIDPDWDAACMYDVDEIKIMFRRKATMDDQGNITYSKPEPFIWE